MSWLAAALVLGCGRFHFEPNADAAAASDGRRDAPRATCMSLPGCTNGSVITCPSGSCYSVCLEPGDQPTQAARCTRAGLHLATITDADEDTCLGAALSTSIAWYWIGLEQSAAATQPTDGWSWVTGEPLTYASWRDPDMMPPPNPDDFDGVEDGFEQCAWKNSAPLLQWEDASCDNSAPGVICEP